MYHLDKMDKLLRTPDDDLTALRKSQLTRAPSRPLLSDSELLRRGLSAQMAREPHSIGDPDPDRARELGEIEIDLDSGPRRIRVAHDPQNGALHLHGVAVLTSEIDPALMRSIELTAGALNEAQGREEQETQRILLSALLSRAVRRHKFLADALVRQLDHERYGAV
jgi:hypothetical protein